MWVYLKRVEHSSFNVILSQKFNRTQINKKKIKKKKKKKRERERNDQGKEKKFKY